jgi:circadian locomoter output cycles kaput protein
VTAPQQGHLQDQLQRKHAELQQLIVQQQEELRRVSEQLLMARYGLMPINVGQVQIHFDASVAVFNQGLTQVCSSQVLFQFIQNQI